MTYDDGEQENKERGNPPIQEPENDEFSEKDLPGPPSKEPPIK